MLIMLGVLGEESEEESATDDRAKAEEESATGAFALSSLASYDCRAGGSTAIIERDTVPNVSL